LAKVYAAGEIVPEDYVLAHKWFNLAAARGHTDSSNNLDVIKQRMTRNQIAEAQKLAREWEPKR